MEVIGKTGGAEDLKIKITNHKLNGWNFLCWVQSVCFLIQARWKIGYQDDSVPKPGTTKPSYQSWINENGNLLSYAINSMDLEVRQGNLFFKTAKDLWDVVLMAYSDIGNEAAFYDLKQQVKDIK